MRNGFTGFIMSDANRNGKPSSRRLPAPTKRLLAAFACVAFLTFIAVAAFLSSYTGRANLCRQTKICINVDYDDLHRLRIPVFATQ